MDTCEWEVIQVEAVSDILAYSPIKKWHSENYSLVITEIKADLKYDYLTWGFYGSSMLAIDWKDWNLCLTCETFKTRCSKTRGFILYEEFHEGAALVS